MYICKRFVRMKESWLCMCVYHKVPIEWEACLWSTEPINSQMTWSKVHSFPSQEALTPVFPFWPFDLREELEEREKRKRNASLLRMMRGDDFKGHSSPTWLLIDRFDQELDRSGDNEMHFRRGRKCAMCPPDHWIDVSTRLSTLYSTVNWNSISPSSIRIASPAAAVAATVTASIATAASTSSTSSIL